MSFDFSTLITDRTYADVSRVKELSSKIRSGTASEPELAEFNSAAMKGAYNYTDLNRVTAAMEALKAKLEGYGYAVPGYQRIEVPHPSTGGGGSRLPDGYTELSWIESTGTQYVDTGFKPNQDTRVVMDAYMTKESLPSFFFGSRNSSYNVNYGILVNSTGVRSTYGASTITMSGASVYQRALLDKNKNVCLINDATVTNTESTFQTEFNLFLFASNEFGTANYFGYISLYSCQIYDNGAPVRDYVPCVNADGKVGLYDLVSATFFGNSGTGVFIAGPEVYGVDDHVQLLLHGEELADSSGHATEITNYGVTVSGAQSKFGGKSLYFNGNSYLTVPVQVEGDMTIDFWVYITGYDVSDPTIFSYATASGWRGVYTHVYSSTTTWGASTSSAQYNAVQGTPISINTWHHIAAVRSGTITKFYLDGALDGTLTDNDTTNGVLYLGEALDVPSISKFSGYVDELRISNVARWHGNFTPKESAYALPAEKNTTNDSTHVEYDPYLWYEVDSPTTEQMTVYLLNVSIIRSVLAVMETTPEVPADMVELMVQEANDIEVILLDVYRQLNIMATTFIPCGEALCGGDNL